MENVRILSAWEGRRRILQLILQISEILSFQSFVKVSGFIFITFAIFEALEPRQFHFESISKFIIFLIFSSFSDPRKLTVFVEFLKI